MSFEKKVAERHDLGRKTIGVDVSMHEIVSAVMQEFVDQKRPELEKKIEGVNNKRFTVLGKLKMLEEIQEDYV